jgi:hypothetical protein
MGKPVLRVRVPPVVVPRYHSKPAYGLVGPTGGTEMSVILGPHAAKSVNYGSRTCAQSIPGLMRPLHAYDPGLWVAGHLLNDNLGGSGTDSRNLTPLTQNANKRHSKYEDKLKRACETADLYHRNNPTATFWYGMRYRVVVSPITFGGFAPYSGAPSHITITASAVRVNKATKVVSDVPLIDRMRNYNFGPVDIHNDDADLV